MAIITPTGKDRDINGALRRPIAVAWLGETTQAEQAPDLLYGESTLSQNKAGTGTVGLIEAADSAAGTANTVLLPNGAQVPTGKSLDVVGSMTAAKATNFIATETGGANALVAALTDAGGNNVAVAAGLRILLKTAHTLQAGANTLNLNGHGTDSIKSHNAVASDIAATYGAGSIIDLVFDGTVWQDMSQ